jgi:hypothetical protein
MAGPVPGIERQANESAEQHAAMLLWGLMDPAKRTVNGLAVVFKRAEGAVRKWRATRRWDARTKGKGRVAECAVAYRDLYLGTFGAEHIPGLADRMRPDVAALLDVQVFERPRVVALAPPAPPPSVEAEVARAAKRAELAKLERLVDGSIGAFAKALVAGKVRVSLSDLPTLIRVKRQILAERDEGVPDDLSLASDHDLRRIVEEAMQEAGLEDEAAAAKARLVG